MIGISAAHDQMMANVINYNEARSGERSNQGCFLPIGKEASSYRGAYRGAIV